MTDGEGQNQYSVEELKKVPSLMDEAYPPIGYRGIIEFVTSEENLNRFSEFHWWTYVADCLVKIDGQMERYLQLKEKFQEGNTNLLYRIENKTLGHVYSNYSQAPAETEHIMYTGDSYLLNTDVALSDQMKYDIVRKIADELSGNGAFEVNILIDSSFTVQDILWSGQQFHSSWKFFLGSVKEGILIAGIAALISLFILIAMTGKYPMKKKRLNYYIDRMPLELVLLIIGCFTFMDVLISIRVLKHILPPLSTTLRVFALLILYGINLLFASSLVRRKKQHILNERSIAWQIFENYHSGISSSKRAIFLILFFILYVTVNVFLVRHGKIGMIFLVFLNLYVGGSILKDISGKEQLLDGVRKIEKENLAYKIPVTNLSNFNEKLAESINHLGDNLERAVKESVKNERRKTELIANVSHDIKTPLTSIISYIGLLKREKTINPKIEEYVEVLDKKSQRLKELMDDLLEVSKINSGNFKVELNYMDLKEFLQQIQGEFYEQLNAAELTVVESLPKEEVVILADGKALWRVMENLYGNVLKYAQKESRVYSELAVKDGIACYSLKNISRYQLNVDASELTERFIQGDTSRNSEGSGLGLSIAKNLVQLMGGRFELYLDGDLFKIIIKFDSRCQEEI